MNSVNASTDADDDLVERVDELEDTITKEFSRLSKELAQLRGQIHALEEQSVDVDGVNQDVIEDLQEDIEELRHVVNVDLDGKSYEQLTRDDKVREIQATLLNEAAGRSTQKAAMDYSDVRFLFGGKPSTGHVYDLMQVAGQERGFDYQERNQTNRLVVDASDVLKGVKTALQVSRRE
jgi:hypothetical protein